MKCDYCGHEEDLYFTNCPNCGAPTGDQQQNGYEAQPVNHAYLRVFDFLKDKLFIVLCILYSVSTALTFFSGSLPIIDIFICVFLWMLHSQVKAGSFDVKHLSYISTVAKVRYILTYVGAGLLAALGLLFWSVFSLLAASAELQGSIGELMGTLDEMTAQIVSLVFAGGGTIIMVIFLFIAILTALFNYFSTGKICKFLKSVANGVKNGEDRYVKKGATKSWLIVIGVFNLISSVSILFGDFTMVTPSLASLSTGVAMIIAAVLVGKYFPKEKN